MQMDWRSQTLDKLTCHSPPADTSSPNASPAALPATPLKHEVPSASPVASPFAGAPAYVEESVTGGAHFPKRSFTLP